MHDPTHGHAVPLLSAASALVALVTDDGGRAVALAIALAGIMISTVRFAWDWQDRREARAARRRTPPNAARARPRTNP